MVFLGRQGVIFHSTKIKFHGGVNMYLWDDYLRRLGRGIHKIGKVFQGRGFEICSIGHAFFDEPDFVYGYIKDVNEPVTTVEFRKYKGRKGSFDAIALVLLRESNGYRDKKGVRLKISTYNSEKSKREVLHDGDDNIEKFLLDSRGRVRLERIIKEKLESY